MFSRISAAKALTMAACVGVLMTAAASSADEAPLSETAGLAASILQDAAAYQTYVTNAAAVETKFKDGNGVRRTLKAGAAYEPGQLDRGEVAYAALLALQDNNFTARVREMARDPGLRREMVDRLTQYPEAVFDIPGADRAAARVSTIIGNQGRKVIEAGAAVKQSAYDVQHSAWSKGAITDRPQRLTLVKTMSATPFVMKPEDTSKLAAAVSKSADQDGDYTRSRAASPAAIRGVALAALAVMGRAGDDDVADLQPLLSSDSGKQCLKWAKLNLYQCLAVAVPRYEDLFCAGVHALMETGQCVVDGVEKPAASRRRY